MKTTRRSFLRISGTGTAAALVAGANSIELVAQAARALGNRTPDDVAADEGYWRDIQNAFTLDRSLINLNNGNSCPSPTVVHEAYKRYLDYSNQAPVYHRGLIERNIEVVRRRLAAEFGCDPEEMAITRNSSESLQIAQNGLDLAPGDEVLTTEQDYGRMLTTWDQRVRRAREIVIKKINFPVPDHGRDRSVARSAITPATKLLHFCHITNLTGQYFPGAEPRAHGPRPRHHHHRRPAPTAWRTSRSSCAISRWITTGPAATSAARADRHRLPLVRRDRIAKTCRCRPRQSGGRRHPQVRGDRHRSAATKAA